MNATCFKRGNPPSGDATHSRYRYANTSRLRRETRRRRWIHRNAVAPNDKGLTS
ncbi:hypothetical protein [uncultured Nostoc sp.]|uniref:hypothetical protein n=1 Tax=uncultured Nostoc sp. TaxID=340711 RepID=UPI0035CA018C